MVLRYMLRLYDRGSASNKKTVRDWLIKDQFGIQYNQTKEYIAETVATVETTVPSPSSLYPTKLKESLIHGDKLLAEALKYNDYR
jgi:hypothetical protein